MTYPISNSMIFTVPLIRQAHNLAQKVYQTTNGIKQAYLNVLAAYATDYYLSCLGFTTHFENSESQDPIYQILSNTGALTIGAGKVLECRPVLPETEACHIPPEVQKDRLGYVAVALNAELTEATILGFYPQAHQDNMPLSQLESLEALIEHLHSPQVDFASKAKSSVVRLSHWLENTIDEGWEIMNNWVVPTPQFAFRSRTSQVNPAIECRKTLQLESLDPGVDLIIGIHPIQDGEIEINVEVSPANGSSVLPDNVTVEVLDETDKVVMEAITQTTHKLALDFSGEPGEQFTIKVAYGEAEVTEVFVI